MTATERLILLLVCIANVCKPSLPTAHQQAVHHHRQAVQARQTGDMQLAANSFAAALALVPSFGQASWELGELFQTVKMQEQAARAYAALLMHFDSSLSDESTYQTFHRTSSFTDTHVDAVPLKAGASFYLANLIADGFGHQHEHVENIMSQSENNHLLAAVSLYTRALEVAPSYAVALYQRGTLQSRIGGIHGSIIC